MLQELMNFCDERFIPSTRKCPNCQNDCQGGCEQCLDAIHFSKIDREYNCSNIAHYYTCKYCYKYSSEIDILISKLQSLKSYPTFDVLSIGCGPCTELVGLHRCMRRAGYSKPLTYMAFEMNEIWKPIHAFFKTVLPDRADFNLKYSYTDAFKSIPRLDLARIDWRPNILILQYVISDMDKAGMPINEFIDNVLINIVPHMPLNSYIILNDINHWKARRWFEYLKKQFCSTYNYWLYRGHFSNNNRAAYEYGTQHPTNRLSCQVDPDIDRKYNPWKFCSSAHLVLKKRS